ncbi:uridine kinase [Pseudonocardia xishanensis]|uniref:Uridine kinase n=1 Tax=Pseudonocardia xishanensis TaxID=630995 RepID=A0ABP8RQ14_9PSEU
MSFRPVTREALAHELAARVDKLSGRVRFLLDGPPPADPDGLAAAVAEELRLRGRSALAVRAADFLRPASLRLEYGHHDEDMFLDGWLDVGALHREVLADGPVLPRLWDAERDRAFRDEYVELGEQGVVVLSGALLLGRGLPAELVAHLHMSRAALGRHTPEDDRWTLPVFERYERERDPSGEADVLVMADHPDRPAMRG